MKLFNFFNKEKKNNSISGFFGLPSYGRAMENGWIEIATGKALLYYQMASPVFTGIDLISKEIASITPVIFDNKNNTYINNHPLLDLLKKPHDSTTDTSFIYEFSTFYLATGNNYMVAEGNINNPPKKLKNVSPLFITIDEGIDGFPLNYIYSAEAAYKDLTFTKTVNGDNVNYINGTMAEIYQTKTFNPNSNLYGLSRLAPLYFDIEQYIESSKHNLSLLKRGMRPTGIFSTEGQLDDDQRQCLQRQIDQALSGGQNSGKSIVLDCDMKFQEASISNRDNDFFQLKQEVTNSIYNNLRIPLPLISTENTSLANMLEAKELLYDNAVIPLTKLIYSQINDFLMKRYDSTGNLTLTFDIGQITALQPRHNRNLQLKSQLNIYTANELRQFDNAPDLSGDGANQLFLSAGLIPVAGQGIDTSIPDDSNPESSSNKDFIFTLSQMRDSNGEKLLTREEIKKLADEYIGQ